MLQKLIMACACGILATSSTQAFSYDSGKEDNFELKIIHINDHHSHLAAEGATLTLQNRETDVEIGGFPRVVSKINELDTRNRSVLKLHAGDAITGTLFFTLFEGEADAAMMNQACFDAFALGNHEFDRGDAGLKKFLDFLADTDCSDKTEVLAANVIPERGVSPLAPRSRFNYIKPFMIKKYKTGKKKVFGPYGRKVYRDQYEKVAIIGIDIANKTKNSSSPDPTTRFLDETKTAQFYINYLRRFGIDKIVLLTHYQYQNDIELAKNLSGVDVIVGGDSHSLLGDYEQFGLNPAGPYPTEATNRDGQKVCIVQAWQYAYVVGELDVEFDPDGNVLSCGGTPHLLVGDTFEQDDQPVKIGAKRRLIGYLSEIEQISVVNPDEKTGRILDGYQQQVDVLARAVIGNAPEDLCFERIPGQGRSLVCDVEETRERGSDISNIVALAFKEQSLTADIAIQNAGGVRIDIPAGDITIEDAYTLLPFANTLTNLQMTGQEILDVLEEALDFALDAGGSTGAYPYASGLRWHADANQPFGSRFSSVEVKLKDDTEWSAIDPAATYIVVTNSFIAAGRDGYLTFGDVSANGRAEDTFLDYAQSFVDYVLRVGTVNKLPAAEYSTQQYIPLP